MKTNRLNITYSAYIIIFSFLYFTLQYKKSLDINNDDYGFSLLALKNDVISIVADRFFNWSARIPIDFAMFSLINQMQLLIIINSFLLVGIFTSFYAINKKLFHDTGNIRTIFMLVTSITLIPVYIANDSILWVTGSFNYLWPAAFFLFGIIRFFIKPNGFFINSLFILSSCFSIYSEQIIIISLFIFPLLFIYKKKNGGIDKTDIIHISLIAINIAIQMASPANEIRYNAEILRGFNDFLDKSIFEKISIGVVMSIDFLFKKYNTLYVTLAMAISYSLFIQKSQYYRIICFFILLPSLASFLFDMSPSFISPINVLSIKNNMFIAIGITSIALVTYSLFIIESKYRLLLPFIFMLSVLIIIVIGFTPATYIERPRVYFFTCVMLIYIIYTLYFNIVKTNENKLFTFSVYITITLGVTQYLIYQILTNR